MAPFRNVPVAAAVLACAVSAQAQQAPNREQARQELQHAQQQLQQAEQRVQNAMRQLQQLERQQGGQPQAQGADRQLQAQERRQAQQQASQGAQALSPQERRFLERAARMGQLEIQASQLALERSQNEQVRELARHLIEERRDAHGELQQIARSRGLELPQQLGDEQRQQLQQLQQLRGDAFDLKYVQDIGVRSHRQALQLFQQRVAMQGGDPEVRAFAQEMLPLLQRHLHLAHTAHAHMAPRDVTQVLGAQGGQGSAGQQPQARPEGRQPVLGELPPGATQARPENPTEAARAVQGPDRRDPVAPANR